MCVCVQGDRRLSIKGEDGRLYHWILPSFFQLLRDLAQDGTDFTIVFRTFGTDLPRVLSTMSAVLTAGAHPLFADLQELKVTHKHKFDTSLDVHISYTVRPDSEQMSYTSSRSQRQVKVQ